MLALTVTKIHPHRPSWSMSELLFGGDPVSHYALVTPGEVGSRSDREACITNQLSYS